MLVTAATDTVGAAVSIGVGLLVGLINGSFYAILSLGLAIIFGLLNIINFSHGAQYMMGAFVAWIALNKLGINYWVALLFAPLVIGALGVVIERTMLRKLYKLDHLYGLLLTFGLALIFEGIFRDQYGISGQSYPVPELLQGGVNLGFMFLPTYRGFVVVAAGNSVNLTDGLDGLAIVPVMVAIRRASPSAEKA